MTKKCQAAMDDDTCSGRPDAVGLLDQLDNHRVGCPKHVGRLAAAVWKRYPHSVLTIFAVNGSSADVKIAERIAGSPDV